jgi:hypothetical protein
MRETNKKTTNKIGRSLIFLLLAAMVFAIMPSALAATNLMGLQGDVNLDGTPIASGNLTILIWDQAAGGTLIYNSSSDYNGAIANGRFDIMLGDGSQNLVLDYGRTYYMDLLVNDQDLDFDGQERRAFQSSAGNITSSAITPGSITTSLIYDGSVTDQKLATISKSKINVSNTWIESEIPSLTNSWSGTVNATRISSQNLLNVNNSQYLQGYDATVFLTNDSNLASRIDSLNSTKAGTGNCPSGQTIQNITSTGVQCVPDQAGQTFDQTLNKADNVQFGGISTGNINASNITARNVSATTFFGNINWSYLLNIPSYVKDYASDISAKLDATDQRYNDTNAINNETANRQNNETQIRTKYDSLGNWSADKTSYNTTTQLNTLYYAINNPAGYYNSTTIPAYQTGTELYNTTNEMLIATSAYNETARIDAINTTAIDAQPKTTLVTAVGNWTADKTSYNTTSQLDTKYVQQTNLVGAVGNWSADKTSYNTTTQLDTKYTNKTYVDSQNSSMKTYADSQNSSMKTYVDNQDGTLQTKTGLVTAVGNWTADKTSYNTTAQLDNRYLQTTPYQNSSAGWTNDSVNTNTSLNIVAGGDITLEGFTDFDTSNAKPSAPVENYTRLFGTQTAGRNMLSVMGPSGVDYIVAASPMDRRTALIIPPGSGAVFHFQGDVATLTAVTATTPPFNMTDGLTLNLVATAVTGSGVSGNQIWARNFSTFAFFRFKSNQSAGLRLFVGLTDQTLAATSIADAANGNYTGVRIGGAFTNWTLVSMNATKGQTNITLNGALDMSMHELKIWLPNNGMCYLQFDSQPAQAFTADQCPDNNALMRYAVGFMNTTASYKHVRVGRIYMEAER